MSASMLERAFTKLVATKPKHTEAAPDGKSGAIVATYADGTKALIKVGHRRTPSGRRRQRGVLVRTLPNREVAFFKLARLYGFDQLVPTTVLTTYEGHQASAQLYVKALPLRELAPELKVRDKHWRRNVIKASRMVPKQQWRQLLLLDLVAGARDRHARNVGVSVRLSGDRVVYKLVAWDNGVAFGETFDKYHNVFHKFLFHNAVNFDAMWPVLERVTRAQFDAALLPLLSPLEVEHAWRRAQFIQEYPYRLPWRVCSKGHYGSNDFPSYSAYFLDENDDDVATSLPA